MNKDNFIKLSVENLSNEPKIHFFHFEKLMDVILSLFLKRVENKKDFYKNERLFYINLLTQKFMVHGFSVKKLIHGITLDSPSQNLTVPILDPFSINTLIRTMIEAYLVQNYLSDIFIDNDLLEGRFEVWMRYGLSKRGNDFILAEAKEVLESDKRNIEQLENSIKKRKFFLDLSDKKKSTFLNQINSEWKFKFDNDKFYPVSWKRLLIEAGIKKVICDQTYNFLSWHVHSQSISILQLKDMWDRKFEKESIRTSIKKLNMFIAFFASDIILSDENFKEAYDCLNEELKDLINFYSLTFRNEKYTIEKINNEA